MISNQSLTPKEILIELDKYIVGQPDAKRSVAIALRNRWRRRQVPSPLREEIAPKNIIMIGPTGVGKTEIARRLAALAQSPFIKVEPLTDNTSSLVKSGLHESYPIISLLLI